MTIDDFIKSLPATMSKGQKALEALSAYRAARQSVPDAVLREIDNCYRHFTEGKPVTAFRSAIRNEGAPLTLGQAFGVPDIRGGLAMALKRRRLALATPDLVAMFTGQGARVKISASRKGAEFAREETNLTVSEIEDWAEKHVTKKRKNKMPG
jgi:hypothetical protein